MKTGRFRIARALAIAGAGCAVAALPARAGSTIDATNRHAYSANVGWIDARNDVTHGAVVEQLFCTGSLYSANCGWIGLGNSAARHGDHALRYRVEPEGD